MITRLKRELPLKLNINQRWKAKSLKRRGKKRTNDHKKEYMEE
jgi:hypothetical protein